MTDSALLGLPYLDAAQSQKHVTHNEALALLDLAVHIALDAMNVTTPPGAPAEGVRVHVGAGASGAFAGQTGKIAAWQDGVWRFLTPRSGWLVWVAGAQDIYVFDGATWKTAASTFEELQELTRLGVGTSADAQNPMTAKLNSALFTARVIAESGTGDLRFVLNKEAAARTLSQLYQTNYSGRAETGLIGDDQFRIKVSANGSSWLDALVADPSSGVVTFPQGIAGPIPGLTLRRVEVFGASGTFVKQSNETLYRMIAMGGGGGGGSGARSASGTAAGGGAGGDPGTLLDLWFNAADISASAPVTIGAGGAGGAQAPDSSIGSVGSAGGHTIFDSRFTAYGGVGGGRGTASAGGAAGVGFQHHSPYAARVQGGIGSIAGAGAAQTVAGISQPYSPVTAAGGGGAALLAAGNVFAGAAGGTTDWTRNYSSPGGGAGGSGISGSAGGAITSPCGYGGGGGGGGGSSNTAATGSGGAGGAGAGGGGGAGGRNGFGGGAGGNGGAGRVVVFAYG